jgi:hypothetical protein
MFPNIKSSNPIRMVREKLPQMCFFHSFDFRFKVFNTRILVGEIATNLVGNIQKFLETTKY